MTILLLFISAFLIRLINLNQSLWLDETIVAKVVRTIPLLQIPFQFSPNDFHPPLYYMLISLWSNFFGSSEIALRLPSIIFCLIAGWYIYKIAGRWASIFFLFNPLIIYYSQEARMYMMATACLSIVLYHFLQPKRKLKDIFFINLFSFLALCTFYGSIFFIAALILVDFFVGTKGKKLSMKIQSLVSLLFGACIAAVFLSPLVFHQLQNAKVGLVEVKNWSLVLGKAEIKNFFMIFLKFATGRLSWYPKWSYYLTAGISTAIIWVFVFVGSKKNKLLGYLGILPLFLGLGVSFWVPMMQYFRFLFVIPIMSILLEKGVEKKQYIRVGMICLYVVFSLIYLFGAQFHREDWKKLVQSINPMQPVFIIIPSSDPLLYYNSSLLPQELRTIEKAQLSGRIQIIPYGEEIYGYDHTAILEKKGCIKETRSTYRGPLILEEWQCKKSFIGHLQIGAI